MRVNEEIDSTRIGYGSAVWAGGTDVEAETPILWPPDANS